MQENVGISIFQILIADIPGPGLIHEESRTVGFKELMWIRDGMHRQGECQYGKKRMVKQELDPQLLQALR